jgi:hypothetical protein
MYYIIVKKRLKKSPIAEFYDSRTYMCFSLKEAEETFEREKNKMVLDKKTDIEISMRNFG